MKRAKTALSGGRRCIKFWFLAHFIFSGRGAVAKDQRQHLIWNFGQGGVGVFDTLAPLCKPESRM